ncbi:unnamed protein product [Ilex paraguariensis]|uniref:Uncharacterized protein n=1 Tax=Ilex paraguariensis TaxID=185542 RepID=A0ABC8SDA7_9AQUA
MKIFGWMQSKLNGKQATRRPNSVSANQIRLQKPCKEEFSDWPHGLLAIGTFGSVKKEDPERCNLQGSQNSCQDHQQDIVSEEIRELQKELELILHNQVPVESGLEEDLETHDLPLEKFFNCLCLEEVERTTGETVCDELAEKESPLQHSTNVVLSKGKDIQLDNTSNDISKKSLSFLLKKMFLCRRGFVLTPTPSLRDSLPESRIDKYSRMEKILRAMLHKKIYPQSSSPKVTGKKYLENRHMSKTDSEDEMHQDGSKWVKTDSECKSLIC